MARRINITIRGELFERLQAVKEHFNVSGVCQDALEREVLRQELRLKEVTNMENVIERLSGEKEEYDKRYVDKGYEDGLDDAKEMDYEELAEALSTDLHVNLRETDTWDTWCADRINELQHGDAMFSLPAYTEGWVQGVREFWESIENRL